jgi:hypothetical protein
VDFRIELCKIGKLFAVSINNLVFTAIPSLGRMGPTVIDKSQPIESIGSRLRDHTRTFDSGVRARSNYRRGRDRSINTEACQCTTCAR